MHRNSFGCALPDDAGTPTTTFGHPGLEIRTHTTPLYTSMFRADDTLIANPHLYGAPASDNPAIVIKREAAPELWHDHQLAFERVWNTARPIPTHT